MCVPSGVAGLFATLSTVAHQVPLSTGFSRREYWSGLPFPPPEDLPDPGIKPVSPASLALAGGFFTHRANLGSPFIQTLSLKYGQLTRAGVWKSLKKRERERTVFKGGKVFPPWKPGRSRREKQRKAQDVEVKSAGGTQGKWEGTLSGRGPRRGRDGDAGATATTRGPNLGDRDRRRPHLDGVEIAWQHPLQVHEQGDGDVGEEVEAQKPLQAAPGAQSPHRPSVGLSGSRGYAHWNTTSGKRRA